MSSNMTRSLDETIEIMQLQGVSPDNQDAVNVAILCGRAYEAYFYVALVTLSGGTPDAEAISSQQRSAVNDLRRREIEADQRRGGPSPSRSLSQILYDQAQIGAKKFHQSLEKELQKLTNKHYEVSMIADSGGKGSPAGDIEVLINGQQYIIELKWQMTSASHSQVPAIRWFTGLADSELFGSGELGGAYYSYLLSKREEYWSYKHPEGFWTQKVAVEGLKAFIKTIGLDINSSAKMIPFLLQKGSAVPRALNQTNFPDGKFVVHANMMQVTLTDLDDLIATFNPQSKLKAAMRGKTFVYKDDRTGEEVVTFGLTKFRNQASMQNKTKRSEAVFSFSSLVLAKLFTDYTHEGLGFKL